MSDFQIFPPQLQFNAPSGQLGELSNQQGFASNNLYYNRSGTDADALVWAAGVTANSGTYSAATLAAMSTFNTTLKATTVWAKLNRLNLFCGDQLAACVVPVKRGGGFATDTIVNFVNGDYTELTGLTGNGANKYLNTGLIASATLTLNDTHLAVYNRSSIAASGGHAIGAATVGDRFVLSAPFTDSNTYSDQYDAVGATGRVNAPIGGTPFGFGVASRTAANAHAIYRNGASIGSTVTTGGALPITNPIFVFGSNQDGAMTSPNAFPFAAYSIGSGLTAAEALIYNTAMQAFQTALARNV